MVHLILLLHKTELLESLLFRRGLIDEGACLLVWLTASTADHTVDSTIQDIKALLADLRKKKKIKKKDEWSHSLYAYKSLEKLQGFVTLRQVK